MEEWCLHRGRGRLWVVTPRHTASPDELVALIVSSEDRQYRNFARVLSFEEGQRERRESGRREDCFLLHLAFPCGDHGLWVMPHMNASPYTFCHPVPRIYYRKPSTSLGNPAALEMELQGRGFYDFNRRAVALRNGTAHLIPEEYRTLFGEPLPC